MPKDNMNVPPSINEAVVARHLARDPTTREPVPDPAICGLHDALRTARLAAEKARRVADAVMANEMETMPARHRRVRDDTWRTIEPALRAIDAAMDRARHDLRTIQQRTHTPPRPTDAAGTFLAGEIRSRLATMSKEQRAVALSTAFADEDDVVLGAVLAASAMLSGIGSAAEMEILRTRWRRERHGADVERAERLSRAMEDTERAGQLALKFVSRLSSSEIVERAEASQRAVEQAMRS